MYFFPKPSFAKVLLPLSFDPDLWLTVVFSVGILHDKSFHVFIVAAEMEGGQLGELYKCGY